MLADVQDWLVNTVRGRLKKRALAHEDYFYLEDAADENELSRLAVFALDFSDVQQTTRGMQQECIYRFDLTLFKPANFLNHSTKIKQLANDMERLFQAGLRNNDLGFFATLASGPTALKREDQQETAFVEGVVEVKLIKHIE